MFLHAIDYTVHIAVVGSLMKKNSYYGVDKHYWSVQKNLS